MENININLAIKNMSPKQLVEFKKVSNSSKKFEEIFIRKLLNEMGNSMYSQSKGANKEALKLYSEMFNAEASKNIAGRNSGFGVARAIQEQWIRTHLKVDK